MFWHEQCPGTCASSPTPRVQEESARPQKIPLLFLLISSQQATQCIEITIKSKKQRVRPQSQGSCGSSQAPHGPSAGSGAGAHPRPQKGSQVHTLDKAMKALGFHGSPARSTCLRLQGPGGHCQLFCSLKTTQSIMKTQHAWAPARTPSRADPGDVAPRTLPFAQRPPCPGPPPPLCSRRKPGTEAQGAPTAADCPWSLGCRFSYGSVPS